MAEIELARKDGFVDRLRGYHVLLDGDQIGEVRAGETLLYDVGPGHHELQLKISWCWSRNSGSDAADPQPFKPKVAGDSSLLQRFLRRSSHLSGIRRALIAWRVRLALGRRGIFDGFRRL